MALTSKELSSLSLISSLQAGDLVYFTDWAGNRKAVDVIQLARQLKSGSSRKSNQWRGAVVRRSVDSTGITSGNIITWSSAAIVDTDGFYSAAVPSRLSIPPGITKVRIFWHVKFESLSSSGMVFATYRLFRYATGAYESSKSMLTLARQGATGFSVNTVNGVSSMINVSEGDYFEFSESFSMTGQDQILQDSYIEIEVLEAIPTGVTDVD